MASKAIPHERELRSILNRIEADTGKKYKIILKTLFGDEKEKHVIGDFKDRDMFFEVKMDTSYTSRGLFWNSKISLNQETIELTGTYGHENDLNNKIGIASFFCTSGDILLFNLGDEYIFLNDGSSYIQKIGSITYH